MRDQTQQRKYRGIKGLGALMSALISSYWIELNNTALGIVEKKFNRGWRPSTNALTENKFPSSTRYSGLRRDNYAFRISETYANPYSEWGTAYDSNFSEQCHVYASSTTTKKLEVSGTGETQTIYGPKDASFGSINVTVDNVLQGTYSCSSSPTTPTQVQTFEATEGWDGSSTSDTVHFVQGSASRKITNAGSGTLTSKMLFKLKTGVTFSGNNPVNINATAHGLSTGNIVNIRNTSSAGALANGNYTVTVVDPDNFTIPFNGTGAGGTCDYSQVVNLSSISDSATFALYTYIEDATKLSRVTIQYETTDADLNNYTNFYFYNWNTGLVNGDNWLYIKKGDFNSVGSPSWSNIYKSSIVTGNNGTGTSEVSFDDSKFYTPQAIATFTGLSSDFAHKIEIERASGKVVIGYLEQQQSLRAHEMHRDGAVFAVNAMFANYLGTRDEDYYDKTINQMDELCNNIQLGDRTATNRSGFGALAVGGMTSAQFYSIGNANNLRTDEPTVTSTSFTACMFGLTLMGLIKVGKLTKEQLTRYKAFLRRLAEYQERRSYTAKSYYNTGNDEFLRASGLWITNLTLNTPEWRIYAYQQAKAYKTADPAESFLRIFGAEADLYKANLGSVLSYLDEKEFETTLAETTSGGGMTVSQTFIELPVGGTVALGLRRTTGTASASSTGSTLVATSGIFNSNDVGNTVYNVTDSTYAVITGYTNTTTVTVSSAIGNTWDGDSIAIYYTKALLTVGGNTATQNELVELTNYKGVNGGGNEEWDCVRGALSTTAYAHNAGNEIKRSLDVSYVQVQVIALYLFGILSGDQYYKNLAISQYNLIKERITFSTGLVDITGGSRNIIDQDVYINDYVGLFYMLKEDGSNVVSDNELYSTENVLFNNIATLGILPESPINPTQAFQILNSIPVSSFVFGWVNTLIYLDYFESTIKDAKINGRTWRNPYKWREQFTWRGRDDR